MIGRDEYEQNQWHSHPPGRECVPVPSQRFPSYARGYNDENQADITPTYMNCFVASDTIFAVFETLFVFFAGQHTLRIHQASKASGQRD